VDVQSGVCRSVLSEPFEAFRSREFPGIPTPTALSLAFSIQGVTGPARRYRNL
jgi:hypothetical protein